MSSVRLENSPGKSADRLLTALKTGGPQTVADLGCAAGVCGEAVRQQLVRLAAEGLVAASAQPRGVGRPAQVWALTPAGNARFPDAHGDFAARLLRVIRTDLGDAALARVVEALAAEAKAKYAAALDGAADLREKVARLTQVRSAEGYMADFAADGDGYVMWENHCPIGTATSACDLFCRAELDTFRVVLGPDASVDPTEHTVNGDRRCAYRVRAMPPEKRGPKQRRRA